MNTGGVSMLDRCPGAANFIRPSLIIKTCPNCGEEIEMVTTDVEAKCPGCGLTVYNDAVSCIEHCEYAKECVGEELYNRVKNKKQ